MRTAIAATVLTATALFAQTGTALADDGPGASAQGEATHSPGVLSGNLVQVPVDVPINVCGLTVDVIGILNPASGNTCS
ncbi:MAG TPA: chaplin [Streptomyces sp.]|nr:chaplin [Streptomyces sp.]